MILLLPGLETTCVGRFPECFSCPSSFGGISDTIVFSAIPFLLIPVGASFVLTLVFSRAAFVQIVFVEL